MIHQGETRPVSPPSKPPAARIKKAPLVSSMPSAIFVGVDGSRPLIFSQRQNRTSGIESTTIQNGLMALEITPETSEPSIRFNVKIWIRTGVTREALQSVLSLAQ